jgi:hypothetical protein
MATTNISLHLSCVGIAARRRLGDLLPIVQIMPSFPHIPVVPVIPAPMNIQEGTVFDRGPHPAHAAKQHSTR